ncbi:MAG: hypothetical protein LBH69_00520 [Methanomassiliicoccaceae archaeon]|jgi:hypothetical protein|nr:hypothetical protein [Methanomassiliicoccaceae archaeon]
MKSLKKIGVLALIMIALIIPAVAIAENVSGDKAAIYDESVRVTGGFNDRSTGTITVKVIGEIIEGDELTITITELKTGNLFGTTTIIVTEADELRGFVNISVSFRIGNPGTYFGVVSLTGTDVHETYNIDSTLRFDVGKSLWSSIWTYVAIILVVVIIAIVIFMRMRALPKVENTGAFTAMEEERRVKKGSSAKKETYKSRSKK